MIRKTIKLFYEGKYAARKLETARLALYRGDVAEVAKYGRVFELTPATKK
jgi:hypothetical protein